MRRRFAGVGFGSQGLSLSDVNNYGRGGRCASDWCRAFSLFEGGLPLELQPIAAGDPANAAGGTGSVPVLLPFALSLRARILEMYIEDLQIACDPTSKNYVQYGAAYRYSFDKAAAAVGYGSVKWAAAKRLTLFD